MSISSLTFCICKLTAPPMVQMTYEFIIPMDYIINV